MTSPIVFLILASIWTNVKAELVNENSIHDNDLGEGPHINYRLPNNSVPTSYLIKVIPYIVVGNFTFEGEASIGIRVLEPTYHLTLHTYNLIYTENSTSLESEDGIRYHATSHNINLMTEFLMIEFDKELLVGNYTLNLTYKGILTDRRVGFFRTSYLNDKGDTEWLAATKFEPIRARWAFPCYDEPALKATWDIWIKHEAKFHALSNMPVVSVTSDPVDGKMWTIFQTTPLMSSYLVAFVISEFKSLQNENGTIRVWGRSNAIEQSRSVLDIADLALKALEEYTDIPYALPKVDHVSLPGMRSRAMENWGLITYRDGELYSDNNTYMEDLMSMENVIIHELTHQWLGNLVSPRWWQYVWLNEGFATYFQYFIRIDNTKDLRKMHRFVVERQQASVLSLDVRAIPESLDHLASNSDDVFRKFNPNTYSKGASIIRMMSHFMTEEKFKTGLRKYLKTYAYSSVASGDLFNTMQEVMNTEPISEISSSRVDVRTVMNTWTEQPAYPLVTVTRNYTSGTTEFRQEVYIRNPKEVKEYPEYKWWIPISWATESDPNFDHTVPQKWLPSDKSSITVDDFNSSDWIIINIQQTGLYRVNYDVTNWNRIANYLNTDEYETIDVLTRTQLLDDAFDLAKSEHLSYSVAWKVASYLHRETDILPWHSAVLECNHLNDLLMFTPSYDYFKVYMKNLTYNIFETVGIEASENETTATNLERRNLMTCACAVGLEGCISATHDKLLSWLDEAEATKTIEPMRKSILCAGMRRANASTWNRMWNILPASNSSTEKHELLDVLGCSGDVNIIRNWIRIIFDNETYILDRNDSYYAFSHIFEQNYYNLNILLDVFESNFSECIERFGRDHAESLPFIIGSHSPTRAQIDKLVNFLSKKIVPVKAAYARLLIVLQIATTVAEKNEPELRRSFNISPTMSENETFQVNDDNAKHTP